MISVNKALDKGLSLKPVDIRLILQILHQFMFMRERLESDDTLKKHYLKLMGLVSSSESQQALFQSTSDANSIERSVSFVFDTLIVVDQCGRGMYLTGCYGCAF